MKKKNETNNETKNESKKVNKKNEKTKWNFFENSFFFQIFSPVSSMIYIIYKPDRIFKSTNKYNIFRQ